MAEANPYTAPTSDVVNETGEFGNPTVFSFNSRAGRLRYLARSALFTLGSYFVLGIVAAVLIGATNADPNSESFFSTYMLFVILWAVAFAIFGLMFVAQRLHDLNHTGWMSLLMLIPLVNLVLGLYLVFGRGTAGANDYGPPPPPNPLGVTIAGLILPVILAIGVVAALAIPAYQGYAIRAQQAQIQNQK